MLRTVQLLESGAVGIRDEIDAPVGEVRWGMVTAAQIELSGNTAVLLQDGKKLVVRVISPRGAKFEIVSTKPPTAREKQNEGTRMLAVKVKHQGKEKLVIDVVMDVPK